jgi:8-oxo-dGTP diphosphatase
MPTTAPNKLARIHVVAGIIYSACRQQLLITQRPAHLHKGGFWEFPGGKVESVETAEAALSRELAEELAIQVSCSKPFHSIDYDYPEKSLCLEFWQVDSFTGEPHANEGQLMRWVPIAQLADYRFPEANQPIVALLLAAATK